MTAKRKPVKKAKPIAKLSMKEKMMPLTDTLNGWKTYIGISLLAVAKALVDYSATDTITETSMAIYWMNAVGMFLTGVGAAHKLTKIETATKA